MSSEKVLIISDLHLTKKFSPAKFDLIKKVISDCDQLIINGDLWEGFGMSLKDFMSSGWRQLFPSLKEKNTVYLFGNHDPKENARYEQFSTLATKTYEFSQNNVDFYVVHGDYFDPTLDMRHPNLPKPLLFIGVIVESWLISTIGRGYLNIYRASNEKMKKWHRSNISNKWLVCGHSHLAELDLETKFANSGIFLRPGLASYLKIEKGEIELKYV
ncbi:MAG: metallophosphoesterase family protein [Candidatus Berkelbacteria bacterium]|nr:metallophosphoesterase family protein [Candidatus Berkelbacteria bacterium]